jgi:hypothetical protein
MKTNAIEPHAPQESQNQSVLHELPNNATINGAKNSAGEAKAIGYSRDYCSAWTEQLQRPKAYSRPQ